MKKGLWTLLALGIAGCVQAQLLQDIVWMSEPYPPYNYVENGRPVGITVEVLLEVLKRVGLEKEPEIEFLPWAESYETTLKQPGSALFSMTHTEERAKLFKFVGPIVSSVVSLVGIKSKPLEIRSVDHMNELNIGVVGNDIGEQLVEALGVRREAIRRTDSAEEMLKDLDEGRVDAIAYGLDIVKWKVKLAGGDPNRYQSFYVLNQGTMGYAFHKDTDPDLIDELQKTLDALREEGFVEKVVSKYLN